MEIKNQQNVEQEKLKIIQQTTNCRPVKPQNFISQPPCREPRKVKHFLPNYPQCVSPTYTHAHTSTHT